MNFPVWVLTKAEPILQQPVQLCFMLNLSGISRDFHSIYWPVFIQEVHQAAKSPASKIQLPDMSGVKFGVLIALRLTGCLLI